jgi:4-amino-4-deoxy-L-arabinose transferase-like glycosyltransferase
MEEAHDKAERIWNDSLSMKVAALGFFSSSALVRLGFRENGVRFFGVLFVFLLLLYFYTRGNEFSWKYHNDEFSKVTQVLSGERNLRHPPLMLTMVSVGVQAGWVEEEPQQVVQAGRFLSALYLALAFVLVVDWAWAMLGPAAAVTLAVVLGCQAGFYEIAHYFKEDALLLFGLALFFCGYTAFLSNPSRWNAGILGLALAVLVGSKYVAWLMVLLVLGQMFFGRKKRHFFFKTFALFFGVGVLFVYWPALAQINTQIFFLKEEVRNLWAGDYGAGLATPHGVYFFELNKIIPWFVLLPGLACFVWGVHAQRLRGWLWIPITGLLLMGALAWTSKYSDRYLLPVLYLSIVMVVLGPFLLLQAGFGAVKQVRNKFLWSGVLSLILGGSFLLHHGSSLRERQESFQEDSRKELLAWMYAHLDPAQMVLAQDRFAKIHDPAFPCEFWSSIFVADWGSLAEQQARGITHWIISYDVYHRYVDERNQPSGKGEEELFLRRQAFYQGLLKSGKILWLSPGRDPKALHPGLALVTMPE